MEGEGEGGREGGRNPLGSQVEVSTGVNHQPEQHEPTRRNKTKEHRPSIFKRSFRRSSPFLLLLLLLLLPPQRCELVQLIKME